MIQIENTTEKPKAEVIQLFAKKKEPATCSFCGKVAPVGKYADNGQLGESHRVICFGCVALATEKLKGV